LRRLAGIIFHIPAQNDAATHKLHGDRVVLGIEKASGAGITLRGASALLSLGGSTAAAIIQQRRKLASKKEGENEK